MLRHSRLACYPVLPHLAAPLFVAVICFMLSVSIRYLASTASTPAPRTQSWLSLSSSSLLPYWCSTLVLVLKADLFASCTPSEVFNSLVAVTRWVLFALVKLVIGILTVLHGACPPSRARKHRFCRSSAGLRERAPSASRTSGRVRSTST